MHNPRLSESTVHEPAREIQVAWRADLCVVGGSCTGVFAAVRAARLGLSVALVEQTAVLGGSATAAQVNDWHSVLDSRGEAPIIGGLTREVVERLRARGSLVEISPVTRSQFQFNSADLALELDALVREHRIRVFLCARCVAAARRAGQIEAAIIEDKSGRRAIVAKVFVDASGDGDLLRSAGFSARRPEVLQPVTMQALVGNFSRLHARYPNARPWSDLPARAPEHGYPLANSVPWVYPWPGLDDVRNIFGPRLQPVDASDADALSAALFEGRRCHRALIDMARAAYPEAPLQIVALPHALGVRETWHATCLHRLTGVELLSGEAFPDSIAQGTYPVDVHSPSGVVLRYLDGREESISREGIKVWTRWRPESEPTPRCYHIPYRALVPRDAANLLIAGRLIDAERDAFGAVRVMVNCNQMGEAVGVAAALALRLDVSVADVPVGLLRSTLVKGGSLLSVLASVA